MPPKVDIRPWAGRYFDPRRVIYRVEWSPTVDGLTIAS